ncbi:MAG TPA: hypothetical protein VIU61_16255, partial [Kofleriaceae bacterium]
FALMEKVRKAEVPPPSNFNRRVTPELDAISLKALSRDVADRYQSAAELAAALDSLIAGYRFDPKELRQFMRQLFRKEYAKELEETELALDAEPGMASSSSASLRPATSPGVGTPTSVLPASFEGRQNQPAEPPHSQPPPTATTDDEHRPRGFWGSLFKKRK